MLQTTLCYVTRGDEVLMLHRVKKKNDINKDKWIGIGGKFELLLIRAPRDLLEIHECVQAVSKQIYNCAMMTFVSTKKLTVHADASMPWTLDGERADGAEIIHVENLHQSILLVH